VYEVERILREEEGSARFLIRWEGFGPEADTWEPEENIAPALVSAFRQRRDVLRANECDDCILGGVKMLWCASCAEHQPADSFSANQRRGTPASRVCLNHHYRTGGVPSGPPRTQLTFSTPLRSHKRSRPEAAPQEETSPPPLPKRAARPLARELSARHADLQVSRCRLYGLPSSY